MRTVDIGYLFQSILRLENLVRNCENHGGIAVWSHSDGQAIFSTIDVISIICKSSGLEVSTKQVEKAKDRLINPELQGMKNYLSWCEVSSAITSLIDVIESECKTIEFLRIDAGHTSYFKNPTEGWDEVITRFPDSQTDIEEASKCFALDRYAASVFHSLAVVDTGIIYLGKFMSVNDPKSGFTAVSNRLKSIVNEDYSQLKDFERQHIELIRQLQVRVEGLKTAWRNKISHVQGRLMVMTTDFTPDVTQEIYFATRAFMRTLASDLPDVPE